MFGFLKKTEEPKTSQIIEFDKNAWIAFVNFVHQTKFGGIQPNWNNRLFIDYKYLDIEYNCIQFRYMLNEGKFQGIEFFVPDDERSTLSCNLINRVNNVADAIIFISDLNKNKYAS